MADFSDENLLWRRCENAWATALAAQNYAVTKLADAENNNPRTQAPIIVVGGNARRAPDIQTVKNGVTEYWEVKFRSRADFDLNGVREYWISYGAFRDYFAIAEETGCAVHVPLFEGPNAGIPGQWFLTDIYKIREFGRQGLKFASDGEQVDAWIWPRSIMQMIDGPVVDYANAHEPILPNEGVRPEIPIKDLAPFEKKFRRLRQVIHPTKVEESQDAGASAASKMIEQDSMVALDTLRRSLGLRHRPSYSVLRIGTGKINVNEILAFMHYGIRVFLITNKAHDTNFDPVELQAFRDSRLLEWAVVPEVDDAEAWVIDGQFDDDIDGVAEKSLDAADLTGSINAKQFRIVHASAVSDVVVTAGAGTGKTETMSERIVFLLATNGSIGMQVGNKPPSDIRLDDMVLVTFTKVAAKEMRARIARTLALRQRLCSRCVLPTLPWMMQLSSTDITTIHTYAQKLIQQGGGAIGLSPDFSVSDRKMDFRMLIKQNLSLQLSDLLEKEPDKTPASHLWLKHLEELWSSLGNNGVDLISFSPGGQRTQVDWGITTGNSLNDQISTVTSSVLERIAISFGEYCLENQVVPVGQLVPTALEALKNSQRSGFKSPRFLFVDEFQDTDAQQMEMILDIKQLLGSSLFVVGDVKQGIYRFRGAEGSAFKVLNARCKSRGLPPPIEFTLNRNFRSGAKLLASLGHYFEAWGSTPIDTSGEIFLLDYDPKKDKLSPDVLSARVSKPASIQKVAKDQFMVQSANQVKKWRKDNPNANIAIICRVNKETKQIQKQIIADGGSCDLMVGGDFYRCPAVRDLRVLLQAMIDTSDKASLLELAETRWMAGIVDPHSGRELPTEFRDEWGESTFELQSWRQRFGTLAQTKSFDRTDLDLFVQRTNILRSMLSVMPVLTWIVECDRIFSPSGSSFSQGVGANESSQEASERRRYARCLDHLLTLLDIEFGDKPLTLVQLLSWLSLQIATNDIEDEPFPAPLQSGNTIALTVHKAKGLEYDFVLVPHTWRRFEFPHNRATRSTVLRDAKKPKILWLWRGVNDGKFFYTNVTAKNNGLWGIDDDESLREETRLLYVAMTRAKQELLVYLPQVQKKSGGATPNSWADLIEMVN